MSFFFFFHSARSFIRPPTLLICPLLDFYLRGPDIGGICSPSGINSDNFFGARDGLLFSRFFFPPPPFSAIHSNASREPREK